jgi:tetrahydromethanopterin S-methyltransferase subunit G
MSFNDDNSNDWAVYKMYVIEEIKDLKDSLEKVKSKVEDIRGLVIETKTKVLGLTVGVPTVISLIIAAAQIYFGG